MDSTLLKVSDLSAARAANEATIAWVAGEEIQQLPKDLYIPPEALEVFLETFEGPLDLPQCAVGDTGASALAASPWLTDTSKPSAARTPAMYSESLALWAQPNVRT